MAIQIPSSTTTFPANTANETYILATGESIDIANAGTDGLAAETLVGGRKFRILGEIEATDAGISIANDEAAAADRIAIGAQGKIASDGRAIELSDGRVIIENEGTMVGGSQALFLLGAFCRLINTGVVEGEDSSAIINNADRLVIDNAGMILASSGAGILATNAFDIHNTGTIVSQDGIGLDLGLGGQSFGKISNFGTIAGADVAINATNGSLTGDRYELVNRGTILGDVIFTNAVSDDLFDLRGGFLVGNVSGGPGDNTFLLAGADITGVVVGGAGDDTFVVADADAAISENSSGGTDTVKTSVNFDIEFREHFEDIVLIGRKDLSANGNDAVNRLTGNKGDNTLNGLDGADTLRGGRGDDLLDGGAGGDTHIFKTGDGEDFIVGFKATGPDKDTIDLSGVKAIKDFDDLIDNHLFSEGNGVAIRAGKDEILFEIADPTDLTAENFIF